MKTSDFLASIKERCEGIEHISPGASSICPRCRDAYGMTETEMQEAQETGTLVEDPHVSKHPCDTCGDLPGDRYEAHGWSGEELIHLNVCGNCLCYFANGDLPRDTE